MCRSCVVSPSGLRAAAKHTCNLLGTHATRSATTVLFHDLHVPSMPGGQCAHGCLGCLGRSSRDGCHFWIQAYRKSHRLHTSVFQSDAKSPPNHLQPLTAWSLAPHRFHLMPSQGTRKGSSGTAQNPLVDPQIAQLGRAFLMITSSANDELGWSTQMNTNTSRDRATNHSVALSVSL